jgi:glycosyltransferase involved in cell wall biosynthesis
MFNILVYSRSPLAAYFFSNMLTENENIQTTIVTENNHKNLKNLLKSNIIQIISADLRGFYGFVWCMLFILFRLIGKPTFLYWIGSDVKNSDKRMLWFSSFFISKHITISPWLVDELKKKGVYSVFYSNPVPHKLQRIESLPEKFTILAYLGEEGNEKFYGGEIIEKMIETLDCQFIILGGKKKQNSKNVTYLGLISYKDMVKIYTKSTVLVRITEHDGFSNMVQEALNSGRYVIWSQKYPYCFYAKDYKTVISHINNIKELNCENIEGMKYYRQQFNMKKCAKKFFDLYSGALYE